VFGIISPNPNDGPTFLNKISHFEDAREKMLRTKQIQESRENRVFYSALVFPSIVEITFFNQDAVLSHQNTQPSTILSISQVQRVAFADFGLLCFVKICRYLDSVFCDQGGFYVEKKLVQIYYLGVIFRILESQYESSRPRQCRQYLLFECHPSSLGAHEADKVFIQR
jgi:hypothetical protein